MKEEYISTIIKLLQKCDDLEMLEIIMQLLQKSRNQVVNTADLA